MKKLNFIKIASLYIGAIMGAGFASGRECWQYFGVFGKAGFKGVLLCVFGYFLFTFMMTYIARSKDSADLGKIVSPINSCAVENALGLILAILLYCVLIAMAAAGGSILEQEFGINKIFGGLIITILTIITILGNFARVSKVFSLVVPALFAITIITVILVMDKGITQSGSTSGYEAGGITPTWLISATVYFSLNILAMVAISGNCAVNSKSRANNYLGNIVGTLGIGILLFVIVKTLSLDMALSNTLDMPMLGLADKVSPLLSILYTFVIFFAVYSASCSSYFGFSTKIPDGKFKKTIIILGAFIAFGISLVGFKIIVEYVYAVMGYIGMLYALLITINFFTELKRNNFKIV